MGKIEDGLNLYVQFRTVPCSLEKTHF